jgi:hypothetical protein
VQLSLGHPHQRYHRIVPAKHRWQLVSGRLLTTPTAREISGTSGEKCLTRR